MCCDMHGYIKLLSSSYGNIILGHEIDGDSFMELNDNDLYRTFPTKLE